MRAEDGKGSVEQFVRRWLERQGAVIVERGGRLVATLPRAVANQLDVDRRVVFAFSPDEAGDDALCVSMGSPLLDRMIASAKAEGLATSFLLPLPSDAAFLERVSEAARKFEAVNASARVLRRRIVFAPQATFYFKVALIADEKREWLINVTVDPQTEKVRRLAASTPAVSVLPTEGKQAMEARAYSVRRLYHRAREHLEQRIVEEAKKFEQETRRRLERDLQKIDEYYRGLMEERVEPLRGLFRKMASISARDGLAQAWQTGKRFSRELAQLKAEADALERRWEQERAALLDEKNRREAEVRDKCEVRAEVCLTHGAWVLTPRVEWELRFRGKGQRDCLVAYDVYARETIGWECEVCERPHVGAAFLCDCSALVCSACCAVCAECDSRSCSLCSEGASHLCDAPLSRDCPIPL